MAQSSTSLLCFTIVPAENSCDLVNLFFYRLNVKVFFFVFDSVSVYLRVVGILTRLMELVIFLSFLRFSEVLFVCTFAFFIFHLH